MSEYNHDPKDRVWYACYGSNLSEERFGYYIFGGYFAAQDRDYKGCNDKTPWSASEIKTFKGSIYFGNDSPKWHHSAVAFFDPNGSGQVLMRLYQITWGQLMEVQDQESNIPSWYDDCHRIGEYQGLPVYTLTAYDLPFVNEPCDDYRDLILQALTTECGMDEESAKRYLETGSLDPAE